MSKGYIEVINKYTGEIVQYLNFNTTTDSNGKLTQFLIERVKVENKACALMEHENPYDLINKLNEICFGFIKHDEIYRWAEFSE